MSRDKKNHQKKIRYLDGRRLRNAIFAGTRRLARRQNHLNQINVFPVPDGDTGTNMVHTMKHISSELAEVSDKSISTVSDQLAESALMGAQGNSGAILAQFFHGFAEGVKGKWKLTTTAFASAVQKARRAAFEALSEPKDGTILTVINDWANYIEAAAKKTEDFVDLLKNGLHHARQSLAETPKKLAVLKKAGVVDAGAQGFVNLLEGIAHFIDKGNIAKIIQERFAGDSAPTGVAARKSDEKIEYQFCTECLVHGDSIDHSRLKKELLPLGNSLIVAGSQQKIRVHIHTNSPDQVYAIISRYGVVSQKKVDDMTRQHRHFAGKTVAKTIGLVTDTSCDLPHDFIEDNSIHVIPLRIIFGDNIYLDKVQLSPLEFYEKLLESPVYPTTSQPPLGDVLEFYQKLVPKYESIISIHLPRVLSGTLQVIEKAAKMAGGDRITCVDGRGISGALGLILMEAAEAIKQGLSRDQVVERINRAVANIKLFIMLPTLKFLVKSGRISKPKGFIGNLLNLNPIVSTDQEGRLLQVGKAFGEKAAMKKSFKMAEKWLQKYKKVKFIVAHANAPLKADMYVSQIKKVFNVSQNIPIVDAAPALGVHAGPGTVGFAMLGYDS